MQFIQFASLAPRSHALTDANSLCTLANHASSLTCQLTPELARQVLRDVDAFDLRASLNLLERWVVVDSLVADLIAVDTATDGHIVKAFRAKRWRLSHWDDEVEDKHADFINFAKSRLAEIDADEFIDPRLASIQALSRELSISFTSIPPDVFQRCLRLISDTRGQV